MATIGWIVSGLGAVVALALLCVLVIHLASKVIYAIEERGAILQHKRDNERLITASWWFSEDEPTRELVRDLGLSVDIHRVRDRWQDARKTRAADEAAK